MTESMKDPFLPAASAPPLPVMVVTAQPQSIPLPLVVDAHSVSGIQREWPVDVCDCFSYVNPVTKECMWFPYFCPMSTLSPCCIVGRIQTQLAQEPSIACEMGERGWLCCCISAFPSMFSPLGGACYFSLLSAAWRQELHSRFNMAQLPPTCTCFGDLNPACEMVHLACLYPCSFFQIYVTLREINSEQTLLARAYVPPPARS